MHYLITLPFIFNYMSEVTKPLNFIEHIIEEDLKKGLSSNELRFRFPPEPNGYLHIGHTKAIGISFGLGLKYNAPVNLRFDDTNPAKEDQEYVDAIKKDVSWLGYEWAEECYSSDYFQILYDWAIILIKAGKAYVDSQSSEAMASQKGTPTQVGESSPYRERSIDENLRIFKEMKEGIHPEGSHVLRAKIDMSHPNMLMRDPLMYRILHQNHHRTGSNWCIYPMYDWTHGESDYIEQISHSLCSLEFKPHRELYNWFLEQIYPYTQKTYKNPPKQREFSRLNLSYTVMSKRKLLRLVEDRIVSGWDDPRMPTISGLRRRGYTPQSLRNFVDKVGVSKRENVIDVSLLESCVREDLNKYASRVMAVLDPIKLIITNYPDDKVELLQAEINPELENSGFREIPFSKELYIERDDFKEEANRKFFRLTIGKEVRLKNAYIIKAESVVKDNNGLIKEVHCTYDTDSLSGSGSEASLRKVKGTLHWVSIAHAFEAEVREYDRLFNNEAPDADSSVDFTTYLNPNSLAVRKAFCEPSLKKAKVLEIFQFTRLGYYNVDQDSDSGQIIFNKTVGLKDTWGKQVSKPQEKINNLPAKNKTQHEKPAIEVIKQLGKKLTNLPDDKFNVTVLKIEQLAKDTSFEDITPLFNTAKKKVGTRIATVIVLKAALSSGVYKSNEIIKDYVASAIDDDNEKIASIAKEIKKIL